MIELQPEVDAVRASWRAFATHAALCPGFCEPVAQECRRPGRQSNDLDPLWDSCCIEAGQELYGQWRLSVGTLKEAERRP